MLRLVTSMQHLQLRPKMYTDNILLNLQILGRGGILLLLKGYDMDYKIKGKIGDKLSYRVVQALCSLFHSNWMIYSRTPSWFSDIC